MESSAPIDAATGAPKWETDTGYPALSGPISYEIDGEQYIAVTAGGARHCRLTGGGDACAKARLAPTSPAMGRVVVYKIGGKAEMTPDEVFEPDQFRRPRISASRSSWRHGRSCSSQLHGLPWRGASVGRRRHRTCAGRRRRQRRETFADVVLDGKYATAGMASFAGTLTPDDAESIRAYIVNRANEDAEGAAAAAPK